jgi:hypothetical protein
MICLALSPVLKYWMHEEATVDPQTSPSGQA